MGYVVGFALAWVGYLLIDWGHYAVQGKAISITYLAFGTSNNVSGVPIQAGDTPTNNRITQGWKQTPGRNIPGAAGPRR